MASTPTTILGFEKPASGDYTGVWDVPFDQMLDVIEEAISGSNSVSTTGGDTTLTLTAYASDLARRAVCRISIGQTLLSNVRIFSLRKREWFVTNESSAGAFTVSFGYDASDVVAVPRGCGCRILIKSDGTVVQTSPFINLTTGQVDSSSLSVLYAKFPVAAENIGCAVLSSTLATPPVSPTTGDRYIVPVGGLVAWSTHDAAIAVWNGSSWDFTAPAVGMLAWDRANHYLVGYDANGWNAGSTTNSHPSGTVSPFYQSTPPTGWTKLSTAALNDAGFKITTTTDGGSTGGSVAFSTLFGRTQVDGHALSQAELPSATLATAITDPGHLHTASSSLNALGVGAGTQIAQGSGGLFSNVQAITVNAHVTGITASTALGGSNTAHVHDLDMRLKYAIMHLASRN